MNLPNKITLSRLVLIPFFVAFFYIDIPCHYLIATIIFTVAALTDFLDGYIARKQNLVTDLGKFLDPIADKVLVLSAFVVMLADFNNNCFMQIDNALLIFGGIGVCIIVAREMAVSSLRMMAAKKGVVLAAEKIGKVKTAFTDVAIIVLMLSSHFVGTVGVVFNYIGIVSFAISVVLTIVSGVSYLVKNSQVFAD